MPSGVGRWSRVLSPDSGTLGFQASFTAPTYEFRFTADDENILQVKRALGGLMMAALPEDALDDALASLRDYFVFYLKDQEFATVGHGLARAASEDGEDEADLAIGYSVD
jgi:hypothetical protein